MLVSYIVAAHVIRPVDTLYCLCCSYDHCTDPGCQWSICIRIPIVNTNTLLSCLFLCSAFIKMFRCNHYHIPLAHGLLSESSLTYRNAIIWNNTPSPGLNIDGNKHTLSTHYGLVTPYDHIDLAQHWFRKWLVAWRHQAITWTNGDSSLVCFCGIHPRAISQQVPKLLFLTICVNIINSKLQPQVWGKWQIDNKSGLVQVMACCRTGKKSLV